VVFAVATKSFWSESAMDFIGSMNFTSPLISAVSLLHATSKARPGNASNAFNEFLTSEERFLFTGAQ
jgi:hypothetical protein